MESFLSLILETFKQKYMYVVNHKKKCLYPRIYWTDIIFVCSVASSRELCKCAVIRKGWSNRIQMKQVGKSVLFSHNFLYRVNIFCVISKQLASKYYTWIQLGLASLERFRCWFTDCIWYFVPHFRSSFWVENLYL